MDPYLEGYLAAERGATACHYPLGPSYDRWAEGYDQAEEDGRALFPRFGKITRKRK